MEKHIEILVDRKEYITKEEAYQAINEQYYETGLDGYQDGIELMNHIAKIPAADIVEVVRCKDCKHRIVNEHYGEKGYLKLKAMCELDTGDPFEFARDAGNDDWFCADGERKDGGQ